MGFPFSAYVFCSLFVQILLCFLIFFFSVKIAKELFELLPSIWLSKTEAGTSSGVWFSPLTSELLLTTSGSVCFDLDMFRIKPGSKMKNT